MSSTYPIAVLAGIVMAASLAGCGQQAGDPPGYGIEVRADRDAQFVNPNPTVVNRAGTTDGTRAGDAYSRYANERVYPPVPAFQTIHEGTAAPVPTTAPTTGN